jgi:hypothetical protein
MDAENEEKTKSVEGLRYLSSSESPRADSCYYEVGNKAYQYQDGAKVYLEFTRIDPGITIYLRSSSNIYNSTIIEINGLDPAQSLVGKEFVIDQGDKFIITAVPQKDREDTTFDFKYRTDGQVYTGIFELYHRFFKQDEQGGILVWVVLACAAVIALLILCCIGVCIKRCCCRGNRQIKDSSTSYNQMADAAREKASNSENAVSATEGAGNELELESIRGSANGDAGDKMDATPVILKQNRGAREAEIKQAYSNPFKQNK